jgi:cytochrome oxidase assembly protein ShyY1
MLARAMSRLVLERRWFLGLLLILAIAATCVRLGLWQLRRLHDERETQRIAEARLRMPVEPLASIGSPAFAGERRVEATGRYDVSRQILLEARTFEGRSGRHLLTPLVLGDGSAVVVDRGWISESTDPSAAAPPAGQASVTGLLLPGEHPGVFTPKPRLSTRVLTRIDLDAITRDMPYRIYPLWLLLEKQEPASAPDGPVAAPLPPPEEPPHLSYAIQWFLFATTALVGYAFLLRREARDRQRGDEPPAFDTEGLESPAPSA